MQIILAVLSALALFAGCSILAAATSALHQIVGGIALVVWAVLLVGAAIVGAINKKGAAS